MQSDRHTRNKDRAYHIWLSEGRPHGKHDDHWHRAEREIAAEEGPAAGAAKPARKPRAKSASAAAEPAKPARPRTPRATTR